MSLEVGCDRVRKVEKYMHVCMLYVTAINVIVCGLYACSGLYVRSSCYIPLDVNSTWTICMSVQDYM